MSVQPWAADAIAQLVAQFGQTETVSYIPQGGGAAIPLTAIINAVEAHNEELEKGPTLLQRKSFNFASADIGTANINDTITDAGGLVWGITHTEATPFNGRLIAYCERIDLITRHRRNS